jgi:hypothetical protein
MINFLPIYWITFAVLLIIIIYGDVRYNLLRCVSAAGTRPYSWGRVQLAWWTLIILAAFITIVCCSPGNHIPALDSSTVILLGISSGTTVTASMIDQSDRKNQSIRQLNTGFPQRKLLSRHLVRWQRCHNTSPANSDL